MTTEQNIELVRRFNALFAAEDLSVIDDLLAPDFVAHNGDEEVHGPEGWRDYVLGGRAELGTVETGTDELIADGDLVAERWWFRAPGATGHGITVHRVADGRLKENWAVFHPDV